MDMTDAPDRRRAHYARAIRAEGGDSLSKVAKLIAPGSRVLDVGTGRGVLGAYLSAEKGCTVDGIEIDEGHAAAARASYRTFLTVDLESARLDQMLPEAEYDAVVCADVLEHLRNPGDVLKQLLRSLRPSGRIIISIPNVGYAGVIAGLLEGQFNYTPEGILDTTHVRFYTRHSLLRFLAEQGLQPLSLDFVTLPVEESEFPHLDGLPAAVRSAILSGPDALTYQFIVETVPGESPQPNVAPLRRPRAVFGLQLYWRSGGETYSDAKSVSASGEVGVASQEIRLRLPKLEFPPAGLRLDVADRPGFLRVHSISLLDRDGVEAWRWTGEELSIVGTASEGLVEFSSGHNRWWLSRGDDPFVELPVPSAALARSSEGTLSVRMGWPMSADFFAAERAIVEEGRAWSARSDALKAQLTALEETTRALAEQVERASAAIQVMEARVASNESQLLAAATLTARVEALEDLRARGVRKRTLLHPGDRVRKAADKAWQWEAPGGAAQFLVAQQVDRGWYRVSWRGRSEAPLLLKLHVDYGEGFSEEHGLVFGALDGKTKRRSQYIPIDRPTRALRIDVGNQAGRFDLVLDKWSRRPGVLVQLVTLAGLLRTPRGWRSIRAALAEAHSRGLRATWRGLRSQALYGGLEARPKESGQFPNRAGSPAPKRISRAEAEEAIAAFSREPLVSVLVPCYNTAPRWLTAAVDSVRNQFYPNWELILVDDASSNPASRACLRKLERIGPRVRVLWQERNGGIASATNVALRAATGELVALLDHDDTLTPDALFEVVRRFVESPHLDAVYTDQDKIDEQGRPYESFHKPDWSPELFRGVMYVGHLLVVRRSVAMEVGLFDSRFDKVQDFEFMLRVSERTDRIGHVAKVLYHWRAVRGSVAKGPGEKSGITSLQASAVSEHLARLGVPATAEPHPEHEHRVVLRPRPGGDTPLVSLIIPTKDAPQHISRCLDSVFERSTYPRFEVIVVDNGTTDERALAAIRKHPVQVVPFLQSFNFSSANNLGVQHARGDVLILLNNDTEVIDRDWMETLVFHLLQPGVGIVGPLLLYPNGSVQHAGVVIGVRGTADHLMRGFPADGDGYAGSLCCTREVSGVTAACLAIRRQDYLDLGGLVDHYASHYQDVDLCLRARAQGKRILYVPRARLYHHESATRGRVYDHLDRALLLDSWGEIIRRGDPYYNSNFSLESVDYSPRRDATS